jgi:hypothetical protein
MPEFSFARRRLAAMTAGPAVGDRRRQLRTDIQMGEVRYRSASGVVQP